MIMQFDIDFLVLEIEVRTERDENAPAHFPVAIREMVPGILRKIECPLRELDSAVFLGRPIIEFLL